MKAKINAKSAFLVVLFYLVFFNRRGLDRHHLFWRDTIIPNRQNHQRYYQLRHVCLHHRLSCVVVHQSLCLKDGRKDIFFERKSFGLSKLYCLFLLAWFGVTVFALFNVDFSFYSFGVILLV